MRARPILAGLLLLAIVSGTAHPSRADILDQSQAMHNYGFWFEQSVDRWQEFVPSLPILTRVQLFIDKRGVPGDMVVSIIRRSDLMVLGTKTVPGDEVPAYGWAEALFDETIDVTPGQVFRIHVASDRPSPNPQNRFFWLGQTQTNPYPAGVSSVESGWPGFDFAFRTYGLMPSATRTGSWGQVKALYH